MWTDDYIPIPTRLERREIKRLKRAAARAKKEVEKINIPPPTRRSQRLAASNGPYKPRHYSNDIDVRAQVTITALTTLTSKAVTTIYSMISHMFADEPYEPTSWASAMKHPEHNDWLKASKDEMESLIQNNT